MVSMSLRSERCEGDFGGGRSDDEHETSHGWHEIDMGMFSWVLLCLKTRFVGELEASQSL